MLNFFFLIYFAGEVSSEYYEHAKIYGNTEVLGYYYVDLWVGTPHVKQTVIIDTGSHLTAFPCIGCSDCGHHQDKYFDYENSTTSRLLRCNEGVHCGECSNNQCGYFQSYAEGSSISGILIQDFITFGDDFAHSHTVLSTFGCHRRETHLFRTQLADGIMGIGRSKEVPTLVDLLYKEHDITVDLFSICFGSNDGFMTIGGFNASMHNSEVEWVGMHGDVFYSVRPYKLYINFTDSGVGTSDFTTFYATGMIVDSGTSFTYFANNVYNRLFEKIHDFCGQSTKNCHGKTSNIWSEPQVCYFYNHTLYPDIEDFFNTFPVVSLLIDEVYVDWMPKFYLFAWKETPNIFCVGAYSNGNAGNVLGGNFMRGFDVVFDRTNHKIGFARSECDGSKIYNQNLEEVIDKNQSLPVEVKKDNEKSFDYRKIGFIVVTCIMILASVAGIVVCWFKKRNNAILARSNFENIWFK